MKKLKWGVLLFLILVFVLSSWPSFLAFNQAEQVALEHDVKRMSVALVNEDEGATFNGEQLDFGSEFVRNIEKDSTHNWFIVSRGVAESGIEENVYNMMIVIPHDFTEKALSIDSDSPEKVQISYKINASESNEVRSKANETANSILNDFNRRIIDVYFASVIGNLQDAQDNIQEIVEKQALYTNTYNQSVHSPLANYTAQFSVVQDNAQFSKDSFENFKNILTMFEQNLYDGVNANQKYVTNFSDMLKTHQDNHLYTQGVYEDLNSLRRHMHNDDVMTQQRRLKEATENIFKQFQSPENETESTILTRSAGVQKAFNDAITTVSEVEEQLQKLLTNENKNLKEELKKILGNFDGLLDGIYKKPNDAFLIKIWEQVNKLPTLNENEVVELGFVADPDEKTNTLSRLTNVIKVTNKFKNEFPREEGTKTLQNNSQIPLFKLEEEIKQALYSQGVTGKDTVNLPLTNKNGKELTEFQLSEIPEGFELDKLVLKVDDEILDIRDYEPGVIDISDANGKLDIEATFRLADPDEQINIFEPIRWRWKIHENYKNEEEITNEIDNEQDDESETNIAITSDSGQATEKEIQIENHYATHTVSTSLLEDKRGRYINEAAETVASYERLYALYELYFGFNMAQLPDGFDESSLKALSTDEKDSLYYLFNKSDAIDSLVTSILESITGKTADIITDMNSDIVSFKEFLSEARRNANAMVNLIENTRNEANRLNTNVAATLENAMKWRDDSLLLLEGQQQILANEQEEMTTIVGLDKEFKAFLEQSQALAEQAHSNLTSADHVYDTLETIDNQAKQIQENGAAIVSHANTLSQQLVEKLNNDQDFANNFVNVLANSRVGDRPNEDLYNFLSEPVKVKNDGIIMAGDALTPYFLVLICFIVALFTAYVISTYDERRLKKSSFDEELTTVKRNLPLTAVTASIGVVEGLVICVISGYSLQISQAKLMQWIGLVVLMMVTMLLLATYLLRQLKMIGMFILLMVLTLYLVLTNALSGESKFNMLQQLSPLQHVELMLTRFMQASSGYLYVVISLAGLLVIGLIANLFVLHRSKEEEVETGEGITEAN